MFSDELIFKEKISTFDCIMGKRLEYLSYNNEFNGIIKEISNIEPIEKYVEEIEYYFHYFSSTENLINIDREEIILNLQVVPIFKDIACDCIKAISFFNKGNKQMANTIIQNVEKDKIREYKLEKIVNYLFELINVSD